MRELIVDKIATLLHSFPDIQSWVFGSTARGDYKESSDIDLLILLPDHLSSTERINYQQDIIQALWPLELETEIPISPIILQHKVWNQRISPFTINVNTERIPL